VACPEAWPEGRLPPGVNLYVMNYQQRHARRGRKAAGLALAAASVALLAACKPTASPGAAAGTAAAASGAPAGTTAPASSPAPASGCTPDYCTPANWDTATATTPVPQIKPFSEPLNVVLSARSTVTLAEVLASLKKTWQQVPADTTVTVTGLHMTCISTERADVTGSGYLPMQQAWRLDDCLGGNALSLSGNEGHVRLWHQAVSGSANGAWFIAASYETMCIVKDGALVPARDHKTYTLFHPSAAYHCVDGGPGSITTTYRDGYNDGATAFTADVTRAAETSGWHVSEHAVTVTRTASAGEGGVPFNDTVDLLTITK
jgi:hypothetical protein